jgi:hypothetical protein
MQDASDRPPDGCAAPHPEPPPIDDRLSVRLDSLRRSFRRGLADQIEAVFLEACRSGDAATAADLLYALENMQARAAARGEAGRHAAPFPLAALRAELETCAVAERAGR